MKNKFFNCIQAYVTRSKTWRGCIKITTMEAPDTKMLKAKMLEAINYQFCFGTTEEVKIKNAADNCALLAEQYAERKIKELNKKDIEL